MSVGVEYKLDSVHFQAISLIYEPTYLNGTICILSRIYLHIIGLSAWRVMRTASATRCRLDEAARGDKGGRSGAKERRKESEDVEECRGKSRGSGKQRVGGK